MAKLLCKTRIGVEQQGLQKVWFCAHPNDYPAFLEKTAGQILSIVNCSFWYDGEPEKTYDEKSLEDDLSLMQLFVLPVTERFLKEDNRAILVELQIAFSHRIPILPLLEDEALANLFNEKCGNLQYLCPTKSDETTASFDEKLKKFLSDVLIGDELAQKARDAFDAYIFLSYRKKDRKYANELMKLIHQNDFCRDVAIWYDEFLTPGENFDDAIAKALQKSSLFTMVVTPNLLEENNYVLQKEYPAAKTSGIRILPAEMVETDRIILQEKYPDIPTASNAHNQKTLSNALKKNLSEIAKKEQNADPAHKFFIGLAYLGGIDVEVDRERALKLIKEASDDGLKEGTEKLIRMYRYGEGVTKDKDKLFYYQNRLVEQTKHTYETSPNKQTFENYATALDNLSSGKEEEYLLDEAKTLYLSLLDICEKADFDDKKTVSIWNAHALKRIASCYKKRGEYAQARKYLTESLKKLKSVLGDTLDPAFQLEIAVASLELAKTEYDLGDFSIAFRRIKEAEQTLLQAEEKAVGAKVWMEKIPYSYGIMANLCYTNNKWEDALRYCKKDIQWNARLSSLRHPTKNLYIDCISYNLTAAVLLLLQRKEESHEYAQKSHAFAKEYYEKTASLTAEECYAKTIAGMGKLAMHKKDYDRAKKLYLDAYERFSSLVERTFSTFSVSQQGSLLGSLSFLAKEQGDLESQE
ncbi:MAG: TIR domain-containing protein, partial [Clostridia bacterium]|nr:TIR domain-containing protein [Clostridia bacterium]